MSFQIIWRGVCAMAMAGITACCVAQTQAVCSFTTFHDPAGFFSLNPNGINVWNNDVGFAENKNFHDEGFVRSPSGALSFFQAPTATDTVFTRRNGNGVNVGWYQNSVSNIHGLVLSGSKFSTVNYPGATHTWLSGINLSGTIVGYRINSANHFSGFQWKSGTFTQINFPGATDTVVGNISDNGMIVGWYDVGGGIQHGFAKINGSYAAVNHPLAKFGTQLADVNNSGMIVGNYTAGEFSTGFIYVNGKFKDVKFPNSVQTMVNGVNNLGTITGRIQFSNGIGEGYTAKCQ